MRSVVLGLLLMTGQVDPVSPAETWPQWRGPTHDSVSPTPNLPTHWSRTENVVWKVPLPGKGNSTPPPLRGDRLISVCVQDPKGGGKSYVVAHDKLTGQEKWFTPRDTGATLEPADAYTTPIPYRQGGRVEVIVFGGNVLDAYD